MFMKKNVLSLAILVCSALSVSATDNERETTQNKIESQVGKYYFSNAPTDLKNQLLDNYRKLEKVNDKAELEGELIKLIDVLQLNPTPENQKAVEDLMKEMDAHK